VLILTHPATVSHDIRPWFRMTSGHGFAWHPATVSHDIRPPLLASWTSR